MKKLIFLVLTILLFLPNAFASEEGILLLSSFTIKSQGIGESGPIVISGENNQVGIISLKIEAFGKEYKITDADLKKIPQMSYNGIQLSYEEGYKILGGKTVYIIFQKGFTSGINKKVLISLSENGRVEVEEINN